MTLQERLNALLATEHPDEVAELLRANDVKGDRENCWECPLAKFLTDAPDCAAVTVSDAWLTSWTSDYGLRSFRTADGPLQAFVRQFDDGTNYSDLSTTLSEDHPPEGDR